MSGAVVPFRRKTAPIVWADGRVQTECDEFVHLFESVPGRCQCGKELWETLDEPEAEDSGKPQKGDGSSAAQS